MTHASTGDSWTLRASLGQSLVGSLLLAPRSWCIQGSICALQESVSPVLCKFWRLYDWVNGDFFQECLCHTQVYCTQSPCPCSRPLLTHTPAGDTQTVNGRSVSISVGSPGAHKGFVCTPQESFFSQSCVNSGGSMVGLMQPPSRGLMPFPSLLHPEPLPL